MLSSTVAEKHDRIFSTNAKICYFVECSAKDYTEFAF